MGVRSVGRGGGAGAARAEGKLRAASPGRELYPVGYNRNTEQVLRRGMTGCSVSHRDGGSCRKGPPTGVAVCYRAPACSKIWTESCRDAGDQLHPPGPALQHEHVRATQSEARSQRTEKTGPRKKPRGQEHQRAVAGDKTQCPQTPQGAGQQCWCRALSHPGGPSGRDRGDCSNANTAPQGASPTRSGTSPSSAHSTHSPA